MQQPVSPSERPAKRPRRDENLETEQNGFLASAELNGSITKGSPALVRPSAVATKKSSEECVQTPVLTSACSVLASVVTPNPISSDLEIQEEEGEVLDNLEEIGLVNDEISSLETNQKVDAEVMPVKSFNNETNQSNDNVKVVCSKAMVKTEINSNHDSIEPTPIHCIDGNKSSGDVSSTGKGQVSSNSPSDAQNKEPKPEVEPKDHDNQNSSTSYTAEEQINDAAKSNIVLNEMDVLLGEANSNQINHDTTVIGDLTKINAASETSDLKKDSNAEAASEKEFANDTESTPSSKTATGKFTSL